MHQPFYKNLLTNSFEMPWVRLHAVKGYYDIPSILENFENINLTINIVPSLLEQLIDYSKGNGEDKYLTLSKKEVKTLTNEEKLFIIDNFFSVNHKLHLKEGSRYKELFQKRTNTKDNELLKKRISLFSDKDIQDLQMLFNLSWFGFTAKEKFPIIEKLIEKNGDYSREDILKVLEIMLEIIKDIVPLYKRLLKNGKIELTVSPYYHPILPLVYNTNTAKRCMPDSILPPEFSYPEDANLHIEKAIAYFEQIFGKAPVGMWPSEGSVSPEVLNLISNNKIKWIATDEEILKYSGFENQHRYNYIYKPYSFNVNENNLNLVFRDKNLSDMVGFRCHQVSAKEGADLILKELNSIENYHKNLNDNLMIPIVLDGENPWEYYENSGKEFLKLLFKEIENNKDMEAITISNGISKFNKIQELKTIHSGSWINANYKIWIGHSETNKAWTYLLRVRQFYEKEKDNFEEEIKNKAFKEIMIAEGSDWFWWFGDDFTIKDKDKFDLLFREHLSNVFNIFKKPVPVFLKNPISNESTELENLTYPLIKINPQLTGKKQSFFNWVGAGVYSNISKGSAMFEGESIISNIKYGFNAQFLFLKINNNKSLIDNKLTISIMDNKEYVATFHIKNGENSFKLNEIKESKLFETNINCKYFYSQIIEIQIPYIDFNFIEGETIQFSIEIETLDKIKHKVPSYGYIDTGFKGASTLLSYWTT